MIATIRGNVLANSGQAAIVDVNGIGYQVFITANTARLLSVGSECFLHTALIVREDSMTLFGFESSLEHEIFELLLSVSGVGPKSALGVLSAMTPADISLAVARENDAAFKSVSGIGPKTAKLIAVTLSGKLDHLQLGVKPRESNTSFDESSVIAALQGLGWNERQALEAVNAVVADLAPESSTDAVLRAALAKLGSGKSTAK